MHVDNIFHILYQPYAKKVNVVIASDFFNLKMYEKFGFVRDLGPKGSLFCGLPHPKNILAAAKVCIVISVQVL